MFFLKKRKENRSYLSLTQKKKNFAFSKEDFRFILSFEKERADRGNHQFSLIVIDRKQYEAINGAAQHLIDNIIQRVRDIDIVGWHDNESICVILPYTTFEGANKLVKCISEPLNSSIPKSAYSVHTYPSEGIFGDPNSINFLPID